MEMSEEDRPPEQIWLDAEAISQHFEGVQERYRDKYSTDAPPQQGVEMQENELVKGLRG